MPIYLAALSEQKLIFLLLKAIVSPINLRFFIELAVVDLVFIRLAQLLPGFLTILSAADSSHLNN